LGLGLTTEQIEQILKGEDNGPDDYEFCEEMFEIYEKKLDEINRQISGLETVKYRLESQTSKMMEKRRLKITEPVPF
jgi:DNA-binding transcriptional MerR regulator